MTLSERTRSGYLGRLGGTHPLTLRGVFVLLVVCYLLLIPLYAHLGYLDNLGSRIRGYDSVYYYVYLRSLVFDGDLDFENEWEHYYGSSDARPFETNVFSVGPAILWLPFFSAGHVVTVAASALGSEIAADGYTGIYQAFVYIGNSLYGLIGVLLTALILRRNCWRNGALPSILSRLANASRRPSSSTRYRIQRSPGPLRPSARGWSEWRRRWWTACSSHSTRNG